MADRPILRAAIYGKADILLTGDKDFSATGNTEYIAKQLASRLNDECINILERVKTNNTEPLTSDKPYIICAPVYVCEMPRFMARHLKQTTLNGNREVYFVFTSGGYAGISGQLAEALVKKKNMIYKGHAEITMPRNYVANDHYPMLEKEAVKERIINAYAQLDDIANVIKLNGKLKARQAKLWETIVTVPFNPVWCKKKQTEMTTYLIKYESCDGFDRTVK